MGRFQLGRSRLDKHDSLRGSPIVIDTRSYVLRNPQSFYSQLDEGGAVEEHRANRLQRFFPTPVAEENVWLLTNGTVTGRQPVFATDIAKVWYGGHKNTVTAAEAALLVAAGFTVERV